MNLPNRITIGRLALALALFGFLISTDVCSGPGWEAPLLAAVAFVLVAATDALDGYYARKLGQLSDFGRVADPVVDKIAVCGMFVFVVSTEWGRAVLPAWIVVLVISREFMVSGLRGFIEARGVAFPARWDGKLKMVLQCVVIPGVFVQHALRLGAPVPGRDALQPAADLLVLVSVWAMFLVTVSSGLSYVIAAARVLRGQSGGARP